MTMVYKFLFTFGLLALMLHAVGSAGLGKTLLKLNAGYGMAAVLAQFASTAVAAFRYRIIMGTLGFREDAGFYFGSYFKGAFLNQVLPGSIGGDAARVLELGRIGYRKRDAFAGVLVDRVVGLTGLLLLNLVANNLTQGLLPGWLYMLINVTSVSGIVVVTGLALVRGLSWFERFAIVQPVLALAGQFRRVYHSGTALFTQLGLTVLVHILSIFAVYALAQALGLALSPGVLLVVVPPVFLLTLLPISLAGWGVRESAMVGILMLLGVNNVSALSLSVLYGLTLMIASLPGLYFLLQPSSANR